jgi:hypothetical protein
MINDPEATDHFVEDFSHAFSGLFWGLGRLENTRLLMRK